MYTLFFRESNTPFEIHPMKKTVHTFHIAENIPQKTVKGFVEVLKNGETKVVKSGTADDPETTHFGTFSELENISATVWGFKHFENSDKKIVIFSDLPRSILRDQLHFLMNQLSDKEREELF